MYIPDHRPRHRHPQYHVGIAAASEVREAQKLRYRVLVEELGARLRTAEAGIDVDRFDRYCEHLIVRDESCGRIVGTYRILSPEAALLTGGYHAGTEFDLTRLQHLNQQLVEVGRFCIDPDYRSGTVIVLLWSKLADYMIQNGYQYLMGCASISMADGGHNAANLFKSLADELAPFEFRVSPRSRLPYERLITGRPAETSPLLRCYLFTGAWVCGEPAWDPDFNSAALPLLLPMSRINPRYRQHFFEL